MVGSAMPQPIRPLFMSAIIRMAPHADGGVLGVAEKDEKATITGLRGKWTQISLDNKLLGYVKVSGPAVNPAPVAAPTPAAMVARNP